MKTLQFTLKSIVLAFLLTLTYSGRAQTPPVSISNSLQSILDNSVPSTLTQSGAIMRVVVPGVWEWSGASGNAIAGITAGQPISMAVDTMQFRVGSITKMMVATCIMKLEQDGLLSIDDTIGDYLRATIINDTLIPSAPITIRHLLNHTSGVANSADNISCQTDVLTTPLGSHTLEDAIYCGGSQGEFFTPGLMWGYSNTNYSLLAMIIEEVTGQSYDSYLTQTIITPLGLTKTVAHPADQIADPHMGCYWNIGSWIDLTIINSTTYTGWADIISTTDDLIEFYTQLLDGNIINATQLARMKTIDAASFDYGMGLDFYELVGTDYFGHYGEVANTSGLFFVDVNSSIAPNGYYISYNFNVQGAYTPVSIDEPVITLLSQALSINEEMGSNFSLYPNPTESSCTISLDQTVENQFLEVYDFKGSKVYVETIPKYTSSVTLDVSAYERGMYFLRLQGMKVQRLIVE